MKFAHSIRSRGMVTALMVLLALSIGSCASPPSGSGEIHPSSSLSNAAANADDFALPPGFPDTPEHYVSPDRAPTPYTAEEIRLSCRKGRINKWRMVSPQGQFVSVQRFVSVDKRGARIQSLLVKADGTQSGSTEEVSGTWKEFQSHAAYPAASTTITSERTKVPSGDYDCWVYSVTEDDSVSVYWFAKSLPGAPVRIEVSRGPRVVLDMQLIELVTGKR